MPQQPVTKIQAATAAEVCANFKLTEEGAQLLRDGLTPQEFVATLLENKRHIDAIEFMAHALPVREGIWWGCLCMQHALGDDLPPPDRTAATAVVQWVMQPTEENRAAARAPADAAPPPSVAGALALAAFQTGGSIAPPNVPPMPPPPFAASKAIALAVKLASVKAEPAQILNTQRCYIELALEVAEGSSI